MTESSRVPTPASSAGRRSPRPSRRKRFIVTLAAAAAGFVIVFQFLALQLQAGNDPAVGGAVAPTVPSSHKASAPASSASAPVVTRTSAGATSTPVAGARVPAATQATTTRSQAHHTVLTSASGSGTGTQNDD